MNSPRWRLQLGFVYVLAAAALIYAFCAGFRTIGDFDFGWQIATGRYLAEHHRIPRTDIFTHTVVGAEWLYPPFSGLVFYWLYLAGGYAALSWLLALTTVATIACLLRSPNWGVTTCVAAILAVPSVVFRESPRAELFTTLLFAAYLSILWGHFRGNSQNLWLLPLLMLAWVNLHPGFIAGLAILSAYVLLEMCELPFRDRRPTAIQRLRAVIPWIALSIAATVLNPWGPRIYSGILKQNRSVQELGDFIGEWSRPNLSISVFREMFRWRNPESSFWWLWIFALLAMCVAIRRKQVGASILLACGGFLSLQYLRFQGLFACLAVVVGGAMLDELAVPKPAARQQIKISTLQIWVAGTARIAVGVVFITLVIFRCADLVTNRHYIEAGEVVLFGPGEATWFPEQAANFVLDNHLQPNLFNDYNLGGFLEWRLPEYKTYVDSRAIPFGVTLLTHQRNLLHLPLDAPEWEKEAAERKLNLLILSLDRYTGLDKAPLDLDCQSHNWRPVYLDETSAVFLRNTPENAEALRRLQIDCHNATIPFPEDAKGSSYRARGNAYNFFANAGAVCYLLGRDAEAQEYLARAASIEPHDSNVHLTRAQLFQADNRLQDAEREYKASIEERPTDFAWYLLAILYGKQHRYAEAITALDRSAKISYNPADRYRVIGQVQNIMGQPREALASFDRAERIGSHGSVEDQKVLRAQLASGRARSWQLLHDIDRAIAQQRQSLELLPSDSGRWSTLAELLSEKGDAVAAEKARAQAEALRAAASAR